MPTPSDAPTTSPAREPRLSVPGLSVEDLWLAPGADVVAALGGPDSTGSSRLLFLDTRSGAQRGAVRVGPEELAVLSPSWTYGVTHNWTTGAVDIWCPDTGAAIACLHPHGGAGVHAVALSARGDLGASLGEDGRVVVWRPADGVVVAAFAPRRGVDVAECGLTFSPDAALLAVRPDADALELWRTVPPALVEVLPDHGEPVFSPDGRWIAVDGDGGISLHDLHAGAAPPTLPGVGPVGFTADSAFLVAGGAGGRTTVWRTSRPEPLGYLSGNAWALSPDGSVLVLIGSGNELTLVDPLSGRRLASLTGHRGEVEALAVGSGGRVVAASCSDATLRVWTQGTS